VSDDEINEIIDKLLTLDRMDIVMVIRVLTAAIGGLPD
jgi:hypothetical protein